MKFFLRMTVMLLACGVCFYGCRKRIEPSGQAPAVSTFETAPEKVEMIELGPSAVSEAISPAIVPPPAERPPELSFEALEKKALIHEVQAGETLSGIAAKYDVGTGLVVRLNAIENPNLLRAGRKLKVIRGPFRVIIDKSDKTLSIYLGDVHVKTYDVATGKSDSTPEGDFKIMQKMVKPIWTDPYLRIQVKPEDPRYPLGTRWLQFAEYGYGIHGTNDPASISTEASFGCIRMLNPDVEELYDMISIGSAVQVVP